MWNVSTSQWMLNTFTEADELMCNSKVNFAMGTFVFAPSHLVFK